MHELDSDGARIRVALVPKTNGTENFLRPALGFRHAVIAGLNLQRLGRGEERSQGRDKDSLLADALEAVIAAVYIDGGLDQVRRVVANLLASEYSHVATQHYRPGADDYKTQFQEWCQKRFENLPQYAVVGESGPDHDKRFVVELTLEGTVVGRGSGRTKKEAEQAAAKEALSREER